MSEQLSTLQGVGSAPAAAPAAQAPIAERLARAEAELLRDPTQSDRRIARTADIHGSTVGTLRAKLVAAGAIAHQDLRQGAHGRAQPVAQRTALERLPEIRALIAQGRTTAEIAAAQGVSARYVLGILQAAKTGPEADARRLRSRAQRKARQAMAAAAARAAAPARLSMRQQRIGEIRELVAQGHSAEQIAEQQGVGVAYLLGLCAEAGLKLVRVRARYSIDAARIVRTTCATLASVVRGLDLVDKVNLTAKEAAELCADIDQAMPPLRDLRSKLKAMADADPAPTS